MPNLNVTVTLRQGDLYPGQKAVFDVAVDPPEPSRLRTGRLRKRSKGVVKLSCPLFAEQAGFAILRSDVPDRDSATRAAPKYEFSVRGGEKIEVPLGWACREGEDAEFVVAMLSC